MIRVVSASVAASILILGWFQSLSSLPSFSHIIRLAVFNDLDVNTHLSLAADIGLHM